MAALTVRRAGHRLLRWQLEARRAARGADLLEELARRDGTRVAKGLMLGPPGGRQPDRQQLLAAAVKTTLVRFSLAALPQA